MAGMVKLVGHLPVVAVVELAVQEKMLRRLLALGLPQAVPVLLQL